VRTLRRRHPERPLVGSSHAATLSLVAAKVSPADLYAGNTKAPFTAFEIAGQDLNLRPPQTFSSYQTGGRPATRL
jgi:hypothetical protein